ncbi:MAG: KAP family NTPase, partial [Bdellovibrionaceae bacterium]|nr:KAP family NTPase [Pseudobdellovibrionaceae bacterium]
MKNSVNQNAINYLNYYLSKANKNDFAILIDGAWGSGKTHFIKSYIKAKEEVRGEVDEEKYLYISLYGISSVGEIDDLIFKAAHPILGSKPALLLGQVFKSALKLGGNFDLNNNGSNDLKIDASVPNVGLSTFFNKSKDWIFVFDDLERCQLP